MPFFPKQIAKKAIALYVVALFMVSLLFINHAMQITYIILGVLWVSGFFMLSYYCTVKWRTVSEKQFTRNVFFVALGLRCAWVFFSYFYYVAKTGQPFEFFAADAMWYYEESMGNRNASVLAIIDYLFIHAETISDSGYVFYLSLLAKITGASIMLPRLVNSVFGAYTCVLLYRLTKRNIGVEGGRIAGVFACFMPNLIYYCGLHLKETLMLFLLVAFLERSDCLLRSNKNIVLNIVLTVLLALSLFTFRTVLGASAVFSIVTALVFSRTFVVGRRKRIMLIVWGALAVVVLTGGTIVNELESTWNSKDVNQENKRLEQTLRGNQWAKYATGVVMAPMIFVLPFPTMVDVDEQYNQQMLSGGNYVRNFLGGFVLLAAFSAFFVKKDWRNLSLVGSFVIAYLGIVSASGFANSERFLLPGLPVLLILAAYGVTLLDARNYRFIKVWYWIVPLLIFGWAFFKLGSRGLF